jgi:hypothetical protein
VLPFFRHRCSATRSLNIVSAAFCKRQVYASVSYQRYRKITNGELRQLTYVLAVNDPDESQLPPRNTADEKCWRMISKWLRQCDTSHQSCKSHLRKVNWLPTRLIDVSSAAKICLVISETKIQSDRASYVTLSHRWSSGIPRLTSESLTEWLKELH